MKNPIVSSIPPIKPLDYANFENWLESAKTALQIQSRRSNVSSYNFHFCKRSESPELKEKILAAIEVDSSKTPKKYKYLAQSGLPLPSNLMRLHLNLIQTQKFYISDKSDGYRFLLVGDPMSKQTYLVDRMFNIEVIKPVIFSDFLYRNGLTIIDGELITRADESFEKYFSQIKYCYSNPLSEITEDDKANIPTLIFNMFDTICYEGNFVSNRFYTDRIAELDRLYKSYKENFDSFIKTDTLILNKKLIFHGKDVEKLIKMSFLNKEQDAFRIGYGGIDYLCDGYILTPDQKTYGESHQKIYKWKLPKLNTVDLKIVCGSNCVYLKAKVSIGVYVNIVILNKSEEIYCANVISNEKFETYRKLNNKIGEFSYSQYTSEWVFLKVRVDKKDPNHLLTVIGVLTGQAENIRRKEIRAALASEGKAENV